METEETFDVIRGLARDLGIVDIGVADPVSWDTDPLVSSRIRVGNRPRDIMPGCRSVIVIGIPVQPTILETAPSIYYNHLYNVVNSALDQAAERIALELGIMGHNAVYVPRDGYHGLVGLKERQDAFFSHRHAAYLAGLGTFGYSNMLLTERYGPRIRFASVVTDAVLPLGKPMGGNLCIGCGKCTKECPASALGNAHYPGRITDKRACVSNSEVLAAKGISPCGRCIAVCPVGDDVVDGPTAEGIRAIRSYIK